MADAEKDYWKEGAFLKETHCASLEATTKGGKLNKKKKKITIYSLTLGVGILLYNH